MRFTISSEATAAALATLHDDRTVFQLGSLQQTALRGETTTEVNVCELVVLDRTPVDGPVLTVNPALDRLLVPRDARTRAIGVHRPVETALLLIRHPEVRAQVQGDATHRAVGV